MGTIEDRLRAQLRTLPPKPSDESPQRDKKHYSERLSATLALAFAEELRKRGLKEARPAGPGEIDASSGAERRMAGGIGAKKVDVTWATEESGLLFRDLHQNNQFSRRQDEELPKESNKSTI